METVVSPEVYCLRYCFVVRFVCFVVESDVEGLYLPIYVPESVQ